MFKFSPLEGSKAQELLSDLLPHYLEENTIVFYDDGKVFLRSDAAFKLFSQLEFPFSLLSPGLVIPKNIRDYVYGWVANQRYKFGDRYTDCPIPPVEWRDRFI